MFELTLGFEYVPSSRPWDRAKWDLFTHILLTTEIYIPHSMTTKKLDRMVSKLTHTIDSALDQC